MDALASSLRLKWQPLLATTSGKQSAELLDWLARGTYAPASVERSICLQGIDGPIFISSVAAEINRLSLACSETLRVVQVKPDCPKSAAWAFVKAYYAALFASLVILRVWGKWPTYLRTSDLIVLRDIFKTYGVNPPFSLQSGPFIVHASVTSAEVYIRQGKGGTHEEIWSSLVDHLSDLKSSIISSTLAKSDRQTAEIIVGQIRDAMSSKGSSHSWMSAKRNDIQYRQSFGLWYPYTGRKKVKHLCDDVDLVLSDKWDIQEQTKWQDNEVDLFWNSCLSIVALMRLTLADMRSIKKEKSFLSYGYLQFERSLKP